jgi:hypothetical protein
MVLLKNRRFHFQPLIMLITCTVILLVNCRPPLLRQGWSKRHWGPLVPHKSFPGDCGLCHIPDRWDKLRDDFSFDHQKETGYALIGAHAHAVCLRCHNDRGPVQAYLARGCSGCHPDPHAATLGLECQRCHDQQTWNPIGLIAEHARTRFPLIGIHAMAPCESCHAGAQTGQFRGASTQCERCHAAVLARAASPNHAANNWITDCQRCHVPTGWLGANIQHDFFALSGGHAGLDCTQCHIGNVFTGLSANCYDCHNSNYQAAPDHAAQTYSHSCEQCHSTSVWTPATFDHTGFALTGGHTGLDCSQCHSGGTFTGLSTECYDCHSANYQAAADHAAQTYSHSCEQCHSSTAWTPATIDHSSFTLTGGHAGLDCTQCHTGGTYTGLSTDCYGCHSNNYQGAQDHTSLSFPHDCTDCHTTAAWTPASFQHTFPLTGDHNLSCTDCHTSGNTGSFSCIDCHEHRQSEMDDKHDEENNYSYSSQACYQCHPDGRE